jgi:hypothetical protein
MRHPAFVPLELGCDGVTVGLAFVTLNPSETTPPSPGPYWGVASSSFATDRRRLAAMRLAAQHITADECTTPAEIIRSMLAIQGQDLPGARWSIGLRGLGLTDQAVGAAFDAGEIVRSWPMRGTLHVTAAEDMGWMLELMASRVIRSSAFRRAELGITAQDLERARDAAVAALEGGRALTREGLLSAIAASGVGIDGQRAYHLLGNLAQTGLIVLGPIAGRRQSFVLLSEWVRAPRRLEREEALGELATRYFRSHGPATERDLARWSGLPLGDVRRGVAVCGDKLARLELGGTTYHLAPEALAQTPGASAAQPVPDVRLLPGFDEYLLGYGDRSAAVAPEHARTVVPGNNGMFLPTIVIDGEVVGTWRRRVLAREVVVEPSPFSTLPVAVQVGLAGAARAYGAFLGKPAKIG